LLDLGLPDIDGKDVIELIRQRSAVPIIVVSARHQENEKVAALDQGPTIM
jgi:two-component system KDP operon response regulator KdpE